MNPELDGINHINVYSRARTELGQWLSNFSFTPFIHPEDGQFNSVEGYWYWLSTKDDELRRFSGYKAKQYGREKGGKDWLDGVEFERKVKLALRSKILQSNDSKQTSFINSTLPLTHYYVYSGRVIEVKEGKWIIDYLTKLRDSLKV